MPDLSASASTIRLANGGKYGYRMYLSVVNANNRTSVLEGTVSATPSAYPVEQLNYTLTSGSAADARADYEIEVFTSAGVSKGRLRVAAGGATASVIQVNEYGKSRIEVVSGDKFKVYNECRLRDKLVAANAAFDRDSRIAYTDQNNNIAPVINCGNVKVGFVDDATGTATFSFSATGITASGTSSMSTASPGTFTWAWNFIDGTPSTSTSATPTADFPAGYRLVRLTGTDNANSASYTKYMRVFAHERTGINAPLDVGNVTLSGNIDSGWEAEIEFPYPVSRDLLPDGAEIVLWVEEWYGDQKISYGSNVSGQSNIKFVGIVVSDESTIDAANQNAKVLSIRAVSPLALLQRFLGLSQPLENVSSATNWLTMRNLTLNKAKWFLLLNNSTFARLYDYVVSTTDYPYPLLYIQETTLYTQIKELVEAADGVLTCDRLGRVLDYDNPVIISTSARNALTTTFTLTDADVRAYTALRDHRNTVSELLISGFRAGSTVASVTPLYSKSSDAPGEGDAKQEQQRKVFSISDTAQYLNRCGWLFALLNKTHNGLPVRSGDIALNGNYTIFDFHNEWLTLTLSSKYSARQMEFNSTRVRLNGIQENYEVTAGTAEVNLTYLEETDGKAGVIYVPPIVNDGAGLPDFPPFTTIPIIPITYNPRRIGAWDGINRLPIRIGALSANTDGFAVITLNSDFTSSAVAYTTGLSGDGIDWAQDPYQFARQFVLTSTGLYKVDDIDAFTSWSLVADNATMFGDAARIGVRVIMSNNRRGWIAVGSGYSVAVTFNYGSTWTQVDISGLNIWNTTTPNFDPGNVNLEVSNWNSSTEGHVYASWYQGLNSARIAKSLDYGLTWSLLINRTGGTAGGANRAHIKVPYQIGGVENRNGSAQKIYAAITNVNTFQVYTQATSTESVAISNPSSFPGGALHAFTWDGNRIALANQATMQTKVIATRTAPGAFTATSMIFSGFGAGGDPQVGISGFSFHSDFLCAYWRGSGGYGVGSLSAGNPIMISPDFGANWYNITPTSIWSSPYRTAAAGALLTDFQ